MKKGVLKNERTGGDLGLRVGEGLAPPGSTMTFHEKDL